MNKFYGRNTGKGNRPHLTAVFTPTLHVVLGSTHTRGHPGKPGTWRVPLLGRFPPLQDSSLFSFLAMKIPVGV